MNPKKQKIYLSIIAVCIIGTIGVLLWNRDTSVPVVEGLPVVSHTPVPINGETPPLTAVIKPALDGSYPAPQVFPASTNFDSAVLDSEKFTNLIRYNHVQVAPEELGR